MRRFEADPKPAGLWEAACQMAQCARLLLLRPTRCRIIRRNKREGLASRAPFENPGRYSVVPLNSKDWQTLTHAYGGASDVPELLAQLALNPKPKSDYRSEPWFMLWSSLCHQGTAYNASYAAVPHIVRICLTSDGPIDSSFFQLPACIEIARATGQGRACHQSFMMRTATP